MNVRPTLGRARFTAALALVIVLAGCANPNFIGVQDYGEIHGNVVDQRGRPVANAIVSVGSLATVRADDRGGFVLPHVPVGEQTVSAQLGGYETGSATVIVTKDGKVTAGNVVVTQQTTTP